MPTLDIVSLEAALNSENNAFTTGETADDGDDVDIDDESSVDVEKALEVNSAIAVEKEIAADTLGILFASVGEDFLPYLEASTQELVTLLDHYYEGIRKSAVSSLFEYVKTFYELSKADAWQPGLPVVRAAIDIPVSASANVVILQAVPLHDKVKELVTMIMQPMFGMWETEDDKWVVQRSTFGKHPIFLVMIYYSAHFDALRVQETNLSFFI